MAIVIRPDGGGVNPYKPANRLDQSVVDRVLPLWDALMICIDEGIVPSDWMRYQLQLAYGAYYRGEVDDLADALGVAATPATRRRNERARRDAAIFDEVERVASRQRYGIVKLADGTVGRAVGVVWPSKPKREETKTRKKREPIPTAFDDVARQFKVTSATARAAYRRVKKKKLNP